MYSRMFNRLYRPVRQPGGMRRCVSRHRRVGEPMSQQMRWSGSEEQPPALSPESPKARAAELAPAARRRGLFRDAAGQTYAQFLVRQWRLACSALKVAGAEADAASSQLEAILEPWGQRLIGTRMLYPSYVSQDGFPAELSISWHHGQPEIRILFEALGAEPTALSSQIAARELTRRIGDLPGVELDTYLDIEELFVTDQPMEGRPTIWHSLAWRPGEPLHYKVYLNPQVRGVGLEEQVVKQALTRLGMGKAWAPIGEQYAKLAERGHHIEFFALDLKARSRSRAKVYFRHGPMHRAELGAVAAFADCHDAARAARVIERVYPEQNLVLNEPMTCLAFRHGCDAAREANLYLRMPGATASDADAGRLIASVLESEGGGDPLAYARLLETLAPCPPERATGLQELLTYRTKSSIEQADVGVYFRFAVYD